MNAWRYVLLDADGTIREAWFGVVVEAPTGVIYLQQYGGTATREGRAEGYYVPVSAQDPLTGRDTLHELRQIFENTLKGSGTSGAHLTPDLLSQIRSAVEATVWWTAPPTPQVDSTRTYLRLDESRLRELDEAWLPILTPEGPGVLLWRNSD